MRLDHILGVGRSGTTLLTVLLNNHSKVSVSPEVYFELFFENAFLKKKEFGEKEIGLISEFISEFSKLQPFIGWEFKKELINEIIKDPENCKDYGVLCKKIHRAFISKEKDYKDISIQLSKNPSYTLFWKKLLKINPEARFIAVIRDYRGNILSRKQSIHLRSGEIIYNCLRWNYFNNKLLQLIKKHPEKVCVIRYEDLVEDPEKLCLKICEFLGIQFEKTMLDFYKKEEQNFVLLEQNEEINNSERARKKYADLARKINNNRSKAWKTELTTDEIQKCDILCRKTGSYFGYAEEAKYSASRVFVTYLLSLPKYLQVVYEMKKDSFFYYLPLKMKLIFFRKYISRISTKRNDR